MSRMLRSTTLGAGAKVVLETSSVAAGVLGLEALSTPDRQLMLVNAKDATGVGLTATAGSGNMGIARTAGTSLTLVGEATSGNAKTNAATFFTNLPDSYTVGDAVTVKANAIVSGAGTLTAASTTLEVAANSVSKGVEAALVVTGGAQQVGKTAADLTWSIASTGLAPGSQIALIATFIVTSSSGANTGTINSMAISA